MYGNGVQIIGTKTIRGHPKMAQLGYRKKIKASAWFVAGLGTAALTTAVFQTGTSRITEASLLVFAYPGTNPWSLLPFFL